MNKNKRKILEEIKISSNICNYLQKVYYEFEGYKILTSNLISYSDLKEKNELYDKLMKEYQDKFAEYNLILSEIKNDFLNQFPQFEVDKNLIKFDVDFIKETVVFYIQELNGGRHCGL